MEAPAGSKGVSGRAGSEADTLVRLVTFRCTDVISSSGGTSEAIGIDGGGEGGAATVAQLKPTYPASHTHAAAGLGPSQ